jgi:hypothetical protein
MIDHIPTEEESRPVETVRYLTRRELVSEARRRFGHDPAVWAFRCPNCGAIADAEDFAEAGADPQRVGTECIGRHLGALSGPPTSDSGRARATRGCDWSANSAITGPWVITDDGEEKPSFPLAPVVRALTIRPPWSHFVAHGFKPVENRTKLHTAYRGPVGIHAGRTFDPMGFEVGAHLGYPVSPDDVATGEFVAIARLTDCHWAASDACRCRNTEPAAPWAEPECWHWMFSDVQRITTVEWRGQLGLFTAPRDVAEQLPLAA